MYNVHRKWLINKIKIDDSYGIHFPIKNLLGLLGLPKFIIRRDVITFVYKCSSSRFQKKLYAEEQQSRRSDGLVVQCTPAVQKVIRKYAQPSIFRKTPIFAVKLSKEWIYFNNNFSLTDKRRILIPGLFKLQNSANTANFVN